MNYHRIYNEFIADRRKREPKAVVGKTYNQRNRVGSTFGGCYFEHHHIVPEAMGGTDAAENMISLTAEDHIRAHLLLAKIYGGVLWAVISYTFGGKRTPSRRHIATAALARKLASTEIGKLSKALWETEEYRARRRDSLAKAHANPSVRARLRNAGALRWESEEYRSAHAEGTARLYADPVAAKKISADRSKRAKLLWGNEEYRANSTAKRRAAWADPVKKEKMIAARAQANANQSGIQNEVYELKRRYRAALGLTASLRGISVEAARKWEAEKIGAA